MTTGDSADDTAGRYTDEARAEIRAQTEQLAEKARAAAAAYAARGRDAGAVRVLHLGKALRAMAEQLHEDREYTLAAPVWRAAEEVTGLADRLHRRDVGGLVDTAQDVARRRPAALFGAATVAGFLIGRVLMAPGDHGPYRAEHGQRPAGPERDVAPAAEPVHAAAEGSEH